MASRVLIQSGILRVSKPGRDVFSQYAPQDSLLGTENGIVNTLIPAQYLSFNPSQNGYQQGPRWHSQVGYYNPTGYVPIVVLQQASATTGGAWDSEYLYSRQTTYKDYEDTSPPSYTNYTQNQGGGFLFAVSTNLIQLNSYSAGNTVRGIVFFAKAGDNVFGAEDTTPDTPSWGGAIIPTSVVQTSTVTISGLSAGAGITLEAYCQNYASGNSSNFQMAVVVNTPSGAQNGQNNTGTYVMANGSQTLYFPCQNGDQVYFLVKAPDLGDRITTWFVYNATNGQTFENNSGSYIASFQLGVNHQMRDVVLSPQPGAVSGTTEAYSNNCNVSNINVQVNLEVQFSFVYSGYINGQRFDNASGYFGSFPVYNGGTFQLDFKPDASISGVYVLRRQGDDAVIQGNQNINITVADQANAQWSDINLYAGYRTGQARPTVNGSTNTVTIKGNSTTHTLRVNNDSNQQLFVYRNNQALGGPGPNTNGRTTFDFTVNAGDTVFFNINSQTNSQGTTVIIQDLSSSSGAIEIDRFSVTVDIENTSN